MSYHTYINKFPVAVTGEIFGANKLRTYRIFKNEFITEPYLSIIVHKKI